MNTRGKYSEDLSRAVLSHAREHEGELLHQQGAGPLPEDAVRQGSTNPGRAPAPEKILLQEIPKLENAPGGFVEFENRHGNVWRVEWDNGWVLGEASGAEVRPVELAELLLFVSARLRD